MFPEVAFRVTAKPEVKLPSAGGGAPFGGGAVGGGPLAANR